MTSGKPTRRRILIGASSFADAKVALRLAEQMADTLAEAIGGLMLEEEHVAELLSRPGQQVVSPRGRVLPAPTREGLARVHASDEKAFRAALAALGEARALQWSFERSRGELIAGLLGAASGWDLLLVGHGDGHLAGGRHRRVVLIAPQDSVPDEALAVASTLADLLRADLLTVRAGASAAARRGAAEPGLPELLRRIARLGADVVVLDLAAGPVRSESELRALTEAARCPVLVLGATPENVGHAA